MVDVADMVDGLRMAVPGLEVGSGSAVDEYGRDEGYARRGRDLRPDVVAMIRSTQQVGEVLRYANREGVPVVPRGSGTSLEGQGLAVRGGIMLDMREMSAVRRFLLDDFQVEVEAGITHEDLNKKLRPHGVFFPPNPGAPATIGGMVANNSSGSRAVKYGVTRDYVVQLEVVLPDGRTTRLGSRSVKSASGYDLVDLVVGSEGTLCVVTAIVLRVAPTPEVTRGLVARFDDIETAAALVQPCLGSGILPSSLELLDERVVPTMAARSPLRPGPGAVLLIECDGPSAAAVQEELQAIGDLVLAGGGSLEPISDDDFRAVMRARKTVGWALVRDTGMRTLKLLDVAVPLSAYATVVRQVYDVLKAHTLSGYVLGHAGDGNLHVLIASDWRDESLWQRTCDAERDIVGHALAAEGTITGEHGIGAGKRHLLRDEHGIGVDLMLAIKDVFDPAGIMNPGKVLPCAQQRTSA